MSLVRRSFVPRVLVTIWATCAFLPPGAWALCLGAQGHVAFEPAGIACNQDADHAPDQTSCDAADCGDCVDVPMLTGVAIKHSQPQLDAPMDVTRAHGIALPFTRATHRADPRDARAMSASLSERGSCLRC